MATPRNARPGMLLDPGAPINSGLVGWWPMWEGAGGKTLDISGKNNHAALTNGPKWAGRGLIFDGTNDFVSIGGLVSSVSAATSGSVFVEFSNNADTLAPLFYIGQSGANSNLFRLIFSAANTVQILVKTTADFYRGTVDLGAGSSDGSKHSLLFSVDAAGNKLYYDGRLQTITYTAGSSSTSNWLSSLASLDAASVASDRVAAPNYLSGNIYACRVWNRALSALEAQQLALNPNIGLWVPDTIRYYIPAAGGADVRRKIIQAYMRIAA